MLYASIASADGAVEAVSPITGKMVRLVAPAKRDGMAVAGVSRASAGGLLVTYSRGPACSSGVAGCGPRPHTCGAEVVRVDVADGRSTVIWRVGPDQLLGDAAVSPNGRLLAARASPCTPSYFNDHLVVRRLATGASWTIGAAIPRCHWLGNPQWTSDSAHLVVTFAAPTGTKPYTGPDGTCSEIGDNELIKVDAQQPKPALAGLVRPARSGCTWNSVTTVDDEAFAVEACGRHPGRLDGPARLVRLDSTLHPDRAWPIGRCTNGNSVAADPAAGVILAAYLFCNPPPKGDKLRPPVTVLARLDGTQLHRIATAPGGETAWDDLAW